MEGDVLAVVQPLHLVAHVLEEKPILEGLHLEAALEQAQDESHPGDGNHATLLDVHQVPGVLKVANVGVGEQRVLLIGVEETEVLHDNSHQEVQDDVGDADVEGAEEGQRGVVVAAVGRPEVGPGGAEGRREHGVVHDLVPVLAGDNAKERDDARWSDSATVVKEQKQKWSHVCLVQNMDP